MTITAVEMAGMIDHTLLKPEATPDAIDALCDEAVEFRLGAVCVNPIYVRRVAARLDGLGASGVHRPAIVSVAGFPLGASTSATKVEEARRALGDGAVEIDMVAALGMLLAGDTDAVRRDMESVARAVHETASQAILKIILEAALLPVDTLVIACRLCVEAGADLVKTSTGFHPAGGATVEHVRLLKRHAAALGVKASGGIRSAAAACEMVEAGATRIGTSSGVAIVRTLGTESS